MPSNNKLPMTYPAEGGSLGEGRPGRLCLAATPTLSYVLWPTPCMELHEALEYSPLAQCLPRAVCKVTASLRRYGA